LLGLEFAAVAAICERAAKGQVVAPANLNSQTQVVIAGNQEAVERAVNLAKDGGARRAIMLQVSAPFHCSLLEPAEKRLGPELDSCAFADPRCPVISNVDARPSTTAAAARDALKRQVSRPVRWQESMERMLAEGVNGFVELGPGKVLCGLVRSADKSAMTWNVEDQKSLENAFSGLL
jgi:[acyl-carrier-protein] S-malonyltransferase